MKKLMSATLAFLLCISMVTPSVWAENAKQSKEETMTEDLEVLSGENLKIQEASTQVSSTETTTEATTTEQVSTEQPTTEEPTTEEPTTEQPTTEQPTTEEPVVKPGAVSNLKTAGQSKKSVKLSWSQEKHATSYAIYRKKGSGSYKKIGKTGQTHYLDKGLSYGSSYTYKIVSCYENQGNLEEAASASISYSNKKIVSTSHKHYSYSEMAGDIKQLTNKYNGMVRYKVIGHSVDHRNIYDVILGNPNAKKKLLVVGTMHAREYMATLVTMSQIESYLENYNNKVSGKKIASTLDKVCIHFVPMANPDGVTIAQSGISKIKSASLRAKLRKMSKGSTSTWKANARGVDLNRNWAYKWKKIEKAGASGYSGPYANSEPETKALVSLKKSLKKQGLKATISYHTMGNIVFGKTKKASIRYMTTKMYRLAKSMTGYGCGDTLYKSSGIGNSREWDMYCLGLPSITLEVGRKPAPGPISEFKSIWKKNKNVVIRQAMLFD